MKGVYKNMKIYLNHEILTHNQGVAGSSPAGPTFILSHFRNFRS